MKAQELMPNNKIVVNCFYKEEYINVLKIFEKEGLKWVSGHKPIEKTWYWDDLTKNISLYYEDDFHYRYNEQPRPSEYTSITAKEFIKLKEEFPKKWCIKTCKEVGDWLDVHSDMDKKYRLITGYATCSFKYLLYPSLCSSHMYNDIMGGYKEITMEQFKKYVLKEEEFVLPDRWCIRFTDENQSVLKKWIISHTDYDKDYKGFSVGYWCLSDRYDGSYMYYNKKIVKDGYTEITFEQFQKYVLKSTNKMNKKQKFAIIGSLPLQEAFIKEIGIPYIPAASLERSYAVYPYLSSSIANDRFSSISGIDDEITFSLPENWDEAIEYVKAYFKEEPKEETIVVDGYTAKVENGKIAFGCNKFSSRELTALKTVINMSNELGYELHIGGEKAHVVDDEERTLSIETINKLLKMLKK